MHTCVILVFWGNLNKSHLAKYTISGSALKIKKYLSKIAGIIHTWENAQIMS